MGFVFLLVRAFIVSLLTACYYQTPATRNIAVGFFAAVVFFVAFYMRFSKPKPPPSPPVPQGKVRICVAGFSVSAPTAKAHDLADKLARTYPDKFETWYYFSTFAFYKFVVPKFRNVEFPKHLKGHATSPFVWLERGADSAIEPIGGCDDFSRWVLRHPDVDDLDISACAAAKPSKVGYITGKCDHANRAPPTCRGV